MDSGTIVLGSAASQTLMLVSKLSAVDPREVAVTSSGRQSIENIGPRSVSESRYRLTTMEVVVVNAGITE